MIPLGVLASARVEVSTFALVQSGFTATGTGQLSVSVVLPSAPTPGNVLVIGVGTGYTDPSTFTYSHDISLDAEYYAGNWACGLASGVVQSADSATVTVGSLSAGYPHQMSVWEVANLGAYQDSESAFAAGTSVTLDTATGSGAAFAVCYWNNTASSPSASGMTVTGSSTRGFSAYKIGPAQPFSTTLTWATSRTYAALLGSYA